MNPSRNDPCPCGSGKKYKHCCETKNKAKGQSAIKMPTVTELNQLLALFNAGHLDEVASQARLLTVNFPTLAPAWKLLGICLHRQGKGYEALPVLLNAAKLLPNDAEAHYNLGVTQASLKLLDNAAASYRRAVALKPDFAAAYTNLGEVLRNLGQPENAAASCRRALEIKPDYAGAHQNLGNALADMGKIDDAIVSYRAALRIYPNFAEAFSSLLFNLNHSETVDPRELFKEHCRFAEQFEAPLRNDWPRHTNTRDLERVLQVGFVSGDLRNHAVANFFEPILQKLKQQPRLSLHVYYNHSIEDETTQHLRSFTSHWNAVESWSDEVLANKIRKDDIDILIDLSGHTSKNRLLVFARKPAPVQVSWIGYPCTTGLQAMDYYQSDRYFFPDNRFDSLFIEKIVRLPASAVFLPSVHAPMVNKLPALTNGYVTFGSFNRVNKIGRSVITLWSKLLHAVPDAKLQLGAISTQGEERSLIEWFAQEGIAGDRLVFKERGGMAAYLGMHHQVDICLDTFPYGGSTTTFHALWMGVPTLTLAGNTMAGYASASILGHVGLESFAAHDANDFVKKGVFWMHHLTELSAIRGNLRERLAQSARGRPDLIAAAMERALRIMWQSWCAGLPAEAFEVTLQEAEAILDRDNS
ncbi:MAG: tetratricopeptide repeat protein [Gallionella sp.]|nr:tetratricopeptide repeat protein [Gallionella sp.]